MITRDELRVSLTDIATRSAAIKSVCNNEESTKQHLVLPVIGALGYDYTDPFVVQPEFSADFRDDDRERVDYVIMANDEPVIAIECKRVGTDLSTNRGQLRGYFTVLQSVRLGVLTDGIHFEFFVDCETPNIMDPEPFVTLDLEVATRAPIPDDVIDALLMLSRTNFQPDALASAAELRLVAKRLRTTLRQEVREPSNELCRVILRQIGITNVHRGTIQSHYSSLIRAAFEDAFVLPVVEKLRASHPQSSSDDYTNQEANQRILTTERELAVYRYVCRRLAFLATDEHQFSAVERVGHRDYIGKFSVYYDKVQKGRLFDFVEGSNGYDKFVFPEPFGEIVTNSISEIDEPLRQTFIRRVRELGTLSAPERRALQFA